VIFYSKMQVVKKSGLFRMLKLECLKESVFMKDHRTPAQKIFSNNTQAPKIHQKASD